MTNPSYAEPITLKEWGIIVVSAPLILLVVAVPVLILLTFRLVCGEPWPWRSHD